MQHKTVTILLRIRVRGHFVMSNKKYHEYHYVTVLDNKSNSNEPLDWLQKRGAKLKTPQSRRK